MATFDVSSIGFNALDILGRPMTRIPPEAQSDIVEEINMTVAGTAGATAVDCAILGLKTRLVSSVGCDDVGEFLLSKLAQYGVDTAEVARDASMRTSTSIIAVQPDGARPGYFMPGTADTFVVDPAGYEAALDAKIIHVGGAGLLPSFEGKPAADLLKRAKELGRITTLDVNDSSPETWRKLQLCLSYVDYFSPSIEEAQSMTGLSSVTEIIDLFKAHGASNVVLTLGDAGAYVAPIYGEPYYIPAFDIAVVDTTGCGDGFTAGLIVGLAHDWALEDCARFASAVGSRIALGLGSLGGLKGFDDTLQAMNSLPLKVRAIK
ncbi:MAG: sugar kinase [Rhodospirillaceae bacterium]